MWTTFTLLLIKIFEFGKTPLIEVKDITNSCWHANFRRFRLTHSKATASQTYVMVIIFMYWKFQEKILNVRIWPTSGSNLDVFKVAFLRSIVALIDISTWAHEVSHSLHPNTCKVKVAKAKNKMSNNKVVQRVKKWKTCININCRYTPMISLDHQCFNWINYQ